VNQPPAPSAHGSSLRDATTPCFFHPQIKSGIIRVRGQDRQDFLQRLSTQEINSLQPGEGALTALLNPKGRLLDLLHLLVLEEEMLLLTSGDNGPEILSWLENHLFREDVRLNLDIPDCVGVYGSRAPGILAALAATELAPLRPGYSLRISISGTAVLVTGTFPLAGAGFLLLAPEGSTASLITSLEAAGVQPASTETVDAFRVATGVPAWGREITQEFNPWEAALDSAISLTKGCYLGQEIVARIHTYKKLQRRLTGLEVEGEEVPGPGTPVCHGSREVAKLTSAALSPVSGRVVALAFLPLSLSGSAEELTVIAGVSRRAARVIGLPFLNPQVAG
jgi:tRNA-modifying protein YgfZ